MFLPLPHQFQKSDESPHFITLATLLLGTAKVHLFLILLQRLLQTRADGVAVQKVPKFHFEIIYTKYMQLIVVNKE